MPKAYISAPYTSKAVNNGHKAFGEIKDESYKNFLEAIDSAVKECGLQTLLPQRDILEWGRSDKTLGKAGELGIEFLNSSDIIVAYPEDSKGVNVTIGWAACMKKKIIIVVNEKETLGVVYKLLATLPYAKIVSFKDIIDLKIKLKNCLNEFFPRS